MKNPLLVAKIRRKIERLQKHKEKRKLQKPMVGVIALPSQVNSRRLNELEKRIINIENKLMVFK